MKLTLGTTYYNNPDYLQRYIERNINYVDELIVVDDGSSLPITDYVQPTNKLRLFRTKKDYGFNSHGCRNLIMKQATYDWVILMDVDREFLYPEVSYEIIKKARLNQSTRYCFVAHSGIKDSHQSVNDYLIHRNHFFSAGGYDEELMGMRTGDREYFQQLLHFGKEKILHGVDMMLTRKSSVTVGKLATSKFDKKIDPKVMDLIYRRMKTPEPNKPILTFEWEEISAQPQS